MYSEALAERRIFCSEKMVLKIGLIVISLAVFSNQNMQINAYETDNVLKGYIHENIMLKKEHSNDALFLLKEEWKKNTEQKYGKNNMKIIDEGIVFSRMVKKINSRKIKINVVEINRNINKNIEIIPVMSSNNMHSKSKINIIATQTNAIAAINGTFFKQDTGTPLGTLVINNEIISGPIYERVAFGISDNGYKTARLSFDGKITNGNKILKITGINQPRMLSSQIILYTPKWGKKVPFTKTNCQNIVIKDNKIVLISDIPVNIPENSCVISAPKENFIGFKIGDNVNVKYKLNPNWDDTKHIISGGPYLLKSGEIFIDTESEKLKAIGGKNPRTAIGYTKNNNFIMVTIDGRKEGYTGVTLQELANIMKNLGCYEAINLDGGSSTVMYADGNIYSGTNIKNSVKLSNALVVKYKNL